MLLSLALLLGGTGFAQDPASAAAQRGQARILALAQRIGGFLEAGNLHGIFNERGAAKPAASLGSQALRLAPAEPLASISAEQDKLISEIEASVEAHGASPQSVKEARRLIRAMLSQADPSLVKLLAGLKAPIEIIPKGKKLTDLENWKELKGRKTFDDRTWDDVRGVTTRPGGEPGMAIGEESLLEKSDGNPKDFTFVHEFGHLIHTHALETWQEPVEARRARAHAAFQREMAGGGDIAERAQRAAEASKKELSATGFDRSEAIYAQTMKRKEKTGLGAYADSSVHEMFAQGAAAYFSLGFQGEDAAKLKKVNPDLHSLIERIYGPARDVR